MPHLTLLNGGRSEPLNRRVILAGMRQLRCRKCDRVWFLPCVSKDADYVLVLTSDANRCSKCGGTSRWPSGVPHE